MDGDREAGEMASAHETRCCVVGAGPAGAVLGLLLARGGVPVTLPEAHPDFDRDFRGDTVHPPTLELLAQFGLADRLHALPHSKVRICSSKFIRNQWQNGRSVRTYFGSGEAAELAATAEALQRVQ